MRFADVVIDIANSKVDRTFEYIIPESLDVVAGSMVKVPFGNRISQGYVINVKDRADFEQEKLKEIIDIKGRFPVLTEEQIRLSYYIKAQYHTTLTYALRFMVPTILRTGSANIRSTRFVQLKQLSQVRMLALYESCMAKNGSTKYKKRYDTLKQLEAGNLPYEKVSKSTLDFLIREDAVEIVEENEGIRPYSVYRKHIESLTDEQESALTSIRDYIDNRKRRTILIHGVTGSGKTEVYMRAAEYTLSLGMTVIMLVPEISLTPQLFGEFYNCFGDKVAVIHSGLTPKERYTQWLNIKSGKARIVLGARSAVFAPLENIGLIIIDEEHESSYKSETYPTYHAFEIANIRSRMNNAVLILGSATPQIETYLKAKLGMYDLIELKKRIKDIPLPEMQVVDMRKEFKGGNPGIISGVLYEELKNCLHNKKQALIFINRRGFASAVQCKSCGEVIMCPHCDIPMKYHITTDSLKCHYCGLSIPYTDECPNCGEHFLQNRGVGTQQVEVQIKRLFPEARIIRMDYDSTRKKNSYEMIYDDFKNHKADILIGTQMIARGLDFDDVTVAAIVSADSLINTDDYRADERMFSMIEQVGGRAGRKYSGKVIVQTYDPDNFVIQFARAHDYAGFYNSELSKRKSIDMPPYTRLYRMVFTHRDREKAEKECFAVEEELREALKEFSEDIVLFVAKPAPVEKIQDRYRYHILIKVRNNKNISAFKDIVFGIWAEHSGKDVDISINTNPYETV